MSKKAHDLQTVLDAIKGEGQWSKLGTNTNSFGNISTIAARLGVSRQTIYNYLNEWKTVQAAVTEARETAKDFVENQMMKRIMEGSDTMTIFYAKTQMKERGYIERQEVTGAGGEAVIVKVLKGVSVDDL